MIVDDPKKVVSLLLPFDTYEQVQKLRRDLSRIISAKYNRFMEHITNKAFSVSFPFLHR